MGCILCKPCVRTKDNERKGEKVKPMDFAPRRDVHSISDESLQTIGDTYDSHSGRVTPYELYRNQSDSISFKTFDSHEEYINHIERIEATFQ